MKKFLMLVTALSALVLLVACKGSASIQGDWNAHAYGETEIEFSVTEDTLTYDGVEYTYTQNGIGTKNGISYHILKVSEGEEELGYYSIIFPDKSDKNLAVFLDIEDDMDTPLEGTILAALHKEDTPNYSDYVDKYFTVD